MTRIVDQTVDQIESNVANLTHEIVDFVEDWVKDVADEAEEAVEDFFEGVADGFDFHFDFDANEMPTFNYTFDMDIPALPEVGLSFGFDSLELFMMLDTTLSLDSTYTYNLYTSNSPIGVRISDMLQLGITFSVDLILAVDGDIDISSGFHIRLDDGLMIDIMLFGDEASGIAL